MKRLKLNIQLFAVSASNITTLSASSGNSANLAVSFVENSTDITNNTSNITATSTITMTSGSFSVSSNPTLSVYWHDDKTNTDTLIDSTIVNALSRGNSASASGTFNVLHKDDGTLNGYAFAVWSYTASNKYVPRSGRTDTPNTRLSDIPRSTPAPTVSGNIGQSVQINLNRNSNSFTHTLRYSFGSLENQTIATNIETTYNWTIPTTFYGEIGNNTSGTGTLYVDTYNGQTLIGTTSAEFTATVDENSAKLVIAVTEVIDTDTSITSKTGDNTKFVANASNCRVTFTVTSPSNASVSEVSVNGETLTSPSTRQYTIDNIANQTIIITAKDSRNFTTTQEYTIANAKWIDYIPVSITGTIVRTDGVSGHVAINFNGNYWTGNFGSVTNTLTVQYSYQEEGSTEWSTWRPIDSTMAYTISGTTYQQQNAVTATDINVDKSYKFKLRAIDQINTTGATYDITVNRAVPVAWWNNTYFTVNNILRYTNMSQTSLEDIKKNFMELGSVMDIIRHFKIYSYNYKKEKDYERRHYGFVIPTSEDSQFEVPEQLVSKSNDGIDVYAMCAFLWRAVQEQQEEIDRLKIDMRTKVCYNENDNNGV